LKKVEHAVRETENLQQEYIKINQVNWKTHNDLKCFQNDYEQMMWDYNKMESNIQEKNTITSLEQTYQ
jgi:hypothetical protein